MNLQELQDFVFDFGRVSLAEMKICFQTNGESLRPMLDRLIQKGKVKKSPLDEKCQTCLKCESDELEFYESIESI
ncbi:FeoC like transcriptional regulator [Xenococcus sp. PCC 7305]|uniref:FeoC-like transcriptional regulator n=1 Tax=Xenococcus sp. PCC 7305 TaxID=102125 RepID=UPI0002AC4A9F|nr:FeoC-like transcriptional regulator [Xenococcus sp. PCC 7305]ELS00633.1 FeoC like transcriptional regulator [Xenococcus sp. PCC 7305]